MQDSYELLTGGYSGSLGGDQLDYNNGMAFSTYDRDRDGNGPNCARKDKGAWW